MIHFLCLGSERWRVRFAGQSRGIPRPDIVGTDDDTTSTVTDEHQLHARNRNNDHDKDDHDHNHDMDSNFDDK